MPASRPDIFDRYPTAKMANIATETNIGRAFLATANQMPDLLAIVSDERMLNYAALAGIVRTHVTKMAALGVRPGRVVAVEGEDILTVAATIMATAILGGGWIAQKNSKALAAIITPDLILAPASLPLAEDPGTAHATIDSTWMIETSEPLPDGGDDTAPFMYNSTSGTTGTPKLLAISQEVLCQRSAAARDDFIARETVFCALFAANARPYVTRMIAALINGATILHSRSVGLWYATGMNHLYGSVVQVSTFFGHLTLPRKLPLIHVSGSKLPDGLARHLLSSFDQVIDLYASSETNRSFKNVKYLDADGGLRTRGVALDSAIEIVDEAEHSVKQGQVGLVRVANPYMARNYINSSEASANAFRDGWFYPGDIGYFGVQGELVITGRSGDVINLGGVKLNALTIDEAMRSVSGVADAMCFEHPLEGRNSELLAFVVPDAGLPFTDVVVSLSYQLPGLLGPNWIPLRFIETNGVPRVHDGGAQRFACLALYQDLQAT
jgi:acyl-CoA synthetase (AMP-forming)/AMP-acid ligase II